MTAATGSMIAASIVMSPMASGWAQAQSAVETADGRLEQVVVTAQRREESAQDVPINLQAFSADDLEKSVVRSTEDLSSIVGGFIVQPTAARPAVFLRGVGTNSSNTTPSVLTFIDGVYQPFGQSTDLINVERVDVLKGPQGTLFGRNATGGVIQITTQPPSETFGGRAEVGYGNYDTVDSSAYLTGGLADGVAMDVSVRYRDQDEGFGTNVANGEDVFLSRRFTARSRLRVDFSDVTNLTLAGDYSKLRGTVGANVSPAAGYDSLFVGGALRRRGDFYPGSFDVNANLQPGWETREWGTSLSFETALAGLTFRNITAYRESTEQIQIDFDGGPANGVNLGIERDPRSAFTQELQLLSDGGGRFQWVTGVFYYDGKTASDPFQICAATALNTAGCNQAIAEDQTESIAAYAQGTYAILPETKLTLGARFTSEERSIDGFVQRGDGVEIPGRRGSQTQKIDEPTWRVALDHSFTPDVLGYVSASRGFNSGFFNLASLAGFANSTQNPPVAPEFLTAYEVGAKTDLLDGHLRFNVAAFLYDYDGLQQQVYDQGAVVTINAGAAEMRGVDLEIISRPTRSLTLSLSGTYLDTEYKSYRLAPNYVRQANGSIIAVGNIDAAGKSITNAPELSATASASHELSTALGTFTTSANLNYRGKTFVDPVNSFELPTRYLLNASERWTSAGERYFISLWAENLLNKRYDYAINILTPAGLVGQSAPPRTYGITFGTEF